MMFFGVSVFITFKHTDLKRAVTNCALEYAGLYDHKSCRKPVDRWASDIAERMMCLLTHMRRIANSPVRFQQASSSLCASEVQVLRDMADRVRLDSAPLVGKPTAKADPEDTEKKTRTLARDDSIMSIDSDGLPNLMKLWGKTGAAASRGELVLEAEAA